MNKVVFDGDPDFRIHPVDEVNNFGLRFAETLYRRDSVQGVFFSGSSAFGGDDKYSDVDVNILSGCEDIWTEVGADLASISTIIFSFQPPMLHNLTVFYTEPGHKIDVMVHSDLKELGRYNRAKVKVYGDNEGMITSSLADQDSLMDPQIIVGKSMGLALADLIAVPREISRCNLLEARDNLDEARRLVATSINFMNGNQYFGFDNVSGKCSKLQRGLFEESLKNNGDFEGIRDAAGLVLVLVESLNYFPPRPIEFARERICFS